MERYGLNPFSRPLFRVVWSDSRTFLLGGNWGNGSFEMRETLCYDDIHAWVLEKWQSAEDFAGDRELWDAKERTEGIPSLGPYPSEGDYAFVYAFPQEPTDSMISLVIRAVTASANLTSAERRESILAPLLARQKRAHQRIDDIFDESQPAFRYSDAAISMTSAGRNNLRSKPTKRIKDVSFKHSAEDLGLPMRDNAFFTGESNGSSRSHTGPGA